MDKERIEEEMQILQKKLHYEFKDISYLAEAMRCDKLEKVGNDEYSNEYHAFLGDAIIKFLIADRLYVNSNDKHKGYLTDKKANLESNKVFAKIVEEEDIKRHSYNVMYFFTDDIAESKEMPKFQKHDPYIEAIAAAIYRDGGLNAVSEWFEKWLFPRLEKNSAK